MIYSEETFGTIPDGYDKSRLTDRRYVVKNAATLYERSPNVVASIGKPPGSFILKYFGWRHWLHLVLSPFMASRAQKSWETALSICKAGGSTPKPLYVLTRRKFGFIHENIYICDDITKHKSLRDFLRGNPGQGDATQAAVNLAGCLARIHEAGIYHRDLTPGNILVDENNQCFLVDLNRARLIRRLSVKQRGQDLAKLNFGFGDESRKEYLTETFFSEYSRLAGSNTDWLRQYNDYRRRLTLYRRRKKEIRSYLGIK